MLTEHEVKMSRFMILMLKYMSGVEEQEISASVTRIGNRLRIPSVYQLLSSQDLACVNAE